MAIPTKSTGDLITAADWNSIGDSVAATEEVVGLTLSNNGTDAANDVDIAAGHCSDSDLAVRLVLESALTKRSDAAWAVGSGNGGMDTGTKPNDGTLHVHLIRRSDTGVVDALFSVSATAPTMPTGYDQRRRIGSVLTGGSGDILGFLQEGDRFTSRVGPGFDLDATTLSTSATLLSVTAPSGVRITVELLLTMRGDGSTATNLLVSSPLEADVVPTSTNRTFAIAATGDQSLGALVPVLTETGQVRLRRSGGDPNRIAVRCWGWVDRRAA